MNRKAKIVAWLNRNFEIEEINGERCPTYLYRWELIGVGKVFAIYLHQFVGNDWTRDLHDHPKRFISVGLRGRYIEETPTGNRLFRAPWIRTFPATHIHRLSLVDPLQDCWTLVIVSRSVRQWGFWHNGIWTRWKEYLKTPTADEQRDC
jgi:hypothetical protein